MIVCFLLFVIILIFQTLLKMFFFFYLHHMFLFLLFVLLVYWVTLPNKNLLFCLNFQTNFFFFLYSNSFSVFLSNYTKNFTIHKLQLLCPYVCYFLFSLNHTHTHIHTHAYAYVYINMVPMKNDTIIHVRMSSSAKEQSVAHFTMLFQQKNKVLLCHLPGQVF